MTFNVRPARDSDLPDLVDMLADDPLGAKRERTTRPLFQGYRDAFRAIDADPNNELIVAVVQRDPGGAAIIAGMMQLTFTPYLTHCGTWRATIEGVRIGRSFRGEGLGTRMVRWAIERAADRGCRIVQLTTDKTRPDAKRFYESLDFAATHEGMKHLILERIP